ncbi:MAG TPA: hypothetical protein VG733_12455 [Chthoniobacteraceae bacterium]|nr:hypothetical protein [Chthoniobacteraceae bacterium]
MRILLYLTLLACCAHAVALDNNTLEKWPSPDGKYVIREKFYGEGKRVNADFVNLATGKTAPVYWTGARNLSAIWSPDGGLVAINAETGPHFGEVRLFSIRDGRIKELLLPPNMQATNFLSDRAKANLGHTSFEGIRLDHWLNNTQAEFISETEAVLMHGAGIEQVSEHFIIEIKQGGTKIIKQFSAKKS